VLPEEVPHLGELAYSPQGEQAVVRFELPSVEVIPAVDSHTYVATTSTLRKKKRPKAETAQLYRSVVSQITLLYMRDLFESDPELDNVELAGHVRSVNPAMGQWEYPCLISVATDRATYTRSMAISASPWARMAITRAKALPTTTHPCSIPKSRIERSRSLRSRPDHGPGSTSLFVSAL
jgi:restriction system protein